MHLPFILLTVLMKDPPPPSFPVLIILIKATLISIYYMESITSGEMAGDDWLRSTFSRPLLSRD
jgi:hypothetical protein